MSDTLKLARRLDVLEKLGLATHDQRRIGDRAGLSGPFRKPRGDEARGDLVELGALRGDLRQDLGSDFFQRPPAHAGA